MKATIAATIFLVVVAVRAQTPETGRPGAAPDGSVLLHDGWTIHPLGRKTDVGTFPMAVVPLPRGRAAVLLCGFGEEGIDVVDLATGRSDRLVMPRAWLGLAASADGRKLYASGGADNVVRVFADEDGKWTEEKPFVLGPPGNPIFAAGLALDEGRGRLYVCENTANRLAVFDLATKALVTELPTGASPYEVRLDGAGHLAFVSNWAAASVSAIPLEGSAPAQTWTTGRHPTGLLFDPEAHRLFVACALDDLVAALDTETGRTLWNASVTLRPGDPAGTTPTSLAPAPRGRVLVADSDNNDVAVIDASGPIGRVEGFLPVGRYPTAVAATPDAILVADGKGSVTRSAPDGPQPTDRVPGSKTPRYVLARQAGDLRTIPVSELSDLARHSRTVLAGVPARPETRLRPAYRRIRHVIYVIRENRTYDQVLGDDRRGNGDPSLVLFGENVTPNAHALARRFTLLDNFYCNAEVSADGHNWSSAALANDYVQKTYPQNYSRRGRPYDYDGGNPLARPRDGYLWDAAARANVSFRSYGWFLDLESPSPKASVPELAGRFDPDYKGWDLAYSDLDRVDAWLREFRAFEKSGELPGLEIVYLPNDHTSGAAPGKKTPVAMAAENDRALGRLVEAVTASRYFRDTAIFVLEDDAQNGPDHVDCHRSPVLVISPYTPRGKVDSRMYSTASVLRTIETILGMKPLSQYDASALAMAFEFSGKPDTSPFEALPARVPLDSVNPGKSAADKDAALDFSHPDAAPEQALNDALYRAIQGRPSPAPTVRFGIASRERDDDDDD
jgi:DNA-binding beta-propeller fold protein YncE